MTTGWASGWSPEEDSMLTELVHECGEKSWAYIAQQIKTKNSKQCRRRWKNFLGAEEQKKCTWSPEEDQILLQQHRLLGNKWTEIAKAIGGRTDNAVKNRFTSLQRRVERRQESRGERSMVNDDTRLMNRSSSEESLPAASDRPQVSEKRARELEVEHPEPYVQLVTVPEPSAAVASVSMRAAFTPAGEKEIRICIHDPNAVDITTYDKTCVRDINKCSERVKLALTYARTNAALVCPPFPDDFDPDEDAKPEDVEDLLEFIKTFCSGLSQSHASLLQRALYYMYDRAVKKREDKSDKDPVASQEGVTIIPRFTVDELSLAVDATLDFVDGLPPQPP